MKTQLLRYILCAIVTSFACLNFAIAHPPASEEDMAHFFNVGDWQPDNRRYARSLGNLDIGEPYTVRTIHFIPNDRELDPNMDTKLDGLIKDVQEFYADQMEAYGFGRKTFSFEADDAGNVVVHRVNGKHKDAYYQDPSRGAWIVWREIKARFDMSRNIYLLALDISDDFLNGDARFIGLGTGSSLNGQALIPASNFDGTAHELGHGFGLVHGNPVGIQIRTSPDIGDPMISSYCAAEGLDGHRYFNSSPNNASNDDTDVELLAPSLAAPPVSTRLRFDVADPDGLHQAQLIVPFSGDLVVTDCKRLSGKSTTIEYV